MFCNNFVMHLADDIKFWKQKNLLEYLTCHGKQVVYSLLIGCLPVLPSPSKG